METGYVKSENWKRGRRASTFINEMGSSTISDYALCTIPLRELRNKFMTHKCTKVYGFLYILRFQQ